MPEQLAWEAGQSMAVQVVRDSLYDQADDSSYGVSGVSRYA